MFSIAKLVVGERPDLFVRSTWKFLCFGDLVSWRLGGEAAIDFSMAARTMAFDIHASSGRRAFLGAAGILASWLSRSGRHADRRRRCDTRPRARVLSQP